MSDADLTTDPRPPVRLIHGDALIFGPRRRREVPLFARHPGPLTPIVGGASFLRLYRLRATLVVWLCWKGDPWFSLEAGWLCPGWGFELGLAGWFVEVRLCLSETLGRGELPIVIRRDGRRVHIPAMRNPRDE